MVLYPTGLITLVVAFSLFLASFTWGMMRDSAIVDEVRSDAKVQKQRVITGCEHMPSETKILQRLPVSRTELYDFGKAGVFRPKEDEREVLLATPGIPTLQFNPIDTICASFAVVTFMCDDILIRTTMSHSSLLTC